MKKLFAISSLLFVLALASCTRKDYACSCTYIEGSKKLIQQYDQSAVEAKMECDDHEKERDDMGTLLYTDCSL